MSLKVWLPLNGQFENQGLLGPLTQTATPTYVNGKFGKSLASGGCSMTAEQTASVLNNEAVSICFWVYINADTGTNPTDISTTNMLFGNNGERRFSLFAYPTINDLHCSWENTDESYIIASVDAGVLPSYTWTHVAVTYQNPTIKIYINGKLIRTHTAASNADFSYATQVIYDVTWRYFNDFRIYDHCLSEKEIKEINKGLVLHYPLSSQYETGMQNKYSGSTAEGLAVYTGDFTCTKLADERGYNYKVQYTGNGTNHWKAINFGTFNFTIGKKYYYSCKIRCHNKNFNMSLRASRSDNDWVTNMIGVLVPDGEWHEYFVYQTINETYDRAGSTVTCEPVLEFYTESLLTADYVYSADFDIKDIQVIESDVYVPFIENSMISDTVADCSGFGNNGTRSGVLAHSDNSARYSASTYFDGAQYICAGRGAMVTDAITVSMWGYMDNWNDYGNMISCTQNGGWNFERSGSNTLQFALFRNGAYIAAAETVVLSSYTAGWHHFVGTYDGSTIALYVDGVLKRSTTVEGKYPIGYNTTNGIFIGAEAGDNPTTPDLGYFKGLLSDVRIYATALSVDDIKELYFTAASLDKAGNMYAYEFKED